jgi:MFS family permease
MASIAFVMELSLLPLILAEIRADLGLSLRELSWVFNVHAIAVAGAVLMTGLIGDRVNKQRLFGFGVTIFAIGSVLAAMSSDYSSLILSRLLQGIGGGLFSPLVPILLTRAFPERPGRILMIWGGLAGVVATVLPPIGDLIDSAFGWRALFALFAIVAGSALILNVLDRNSLHFEQNDAPKYSLFPNRSAWPILVFVFLTYGCIAFYLFFLPARLATPHGSVAWILTCFWLSFSFFSFALRGKLDTGRLYQLLLAAPILIAAGFSLAVAFQTSPSAQLAAALCIGAGFACSNSPSTHLLLNRTPEELRAFSSSLDIILARCGSVATVACLASLTPIWAAIAVAGLSLMALLCGAAFLPSTKKPQKHKA